MDSQTVIIKPAAAKKQLKIKAKKIVVEPEVVDQPTDFIAELLKKKMEEEEEEDSAPIGGFRPPATDSDEESEGESVIGTPLSDEDDEIDRQIELLKKKKMEKNKWKVDEINEEIAFQEKEMNEQITRIRNEFLAFKQKKESEIEKLTGKKVSPIVTKTYWRKKTTTAVGEDGEPNWKKKYTPEQYARKVAYDKAWRERKAAGLPTKLGRGVPPPSDGF